MSIPARSDGGQERHDPNNEYDVWVRGKLQDPYSLYRWLRNNDPVHWSEQAQSWVLTRYDAVVSSLQSNAVTAARLQPLFDAQPPDVQERLDPLRAHLGSWVQHYDPPEHGRLRGTARSFFTPRAVEAWRRRVEAATDSALNRIIDHRCDLAPDFAGPLPGVLLTQLLGLPEEEQSRFRGWADLVDSFFEGLDETGAAALQANAAVLEMEAFLAGLLEQKRGHAPTDLLGELVALADSGDLTEQQVYGWGMFLLVAGHENTTGLILNGMAALLDRPDSLAWLRADLSRMPTAIEELLRYDSPLQKLTRIAKEDIEIAGRTIRAGQRIWAILGSANRDEAAFTSADTLLLDRYPNRHVAFGYGIHFCLGAAFARLEGEVALSRLLARFPNITPLPSARTYEGGISNHKLLSLPVAL